jgi:hypothetical protein
VEHNNKPATVAREKATMYQLTQVAADRQRQRLAHAGQQRPAQRLRAQFQAQTASHQ